MRDMDLKLYNALVGTSATREETRGNTVSEEPEEPEEKKVVRRTKK